MVQGPRRFPGFERLYTRCVVAGLVLVMSGCNQGDKELDDPQPALSFRVVAASYPLQYLTQRIGGQKITVEFPVPRGQDPKTWSPKVDAIQDLQSADLVVVNGPGAAYAKWLVRVSLLDSRICNSVDALGTKDYIMVPDYQIVHSHGPEGEHSHEYMVPYAWLDPSVAKKQATAIAKSLEKTYPGLADDFRENLASLHKDLDQLASEYQSASKDHLVVSSNPNAKFLTRGLGRTDRHLLLFDFADPEQVAKATKKLKQLSQQSVHSFVVVQEAGVSPDMAQVTALLDACFEEEKPEVVLVHLLDHAPEQGDYLSEMRELLSRFQ